MVLDDLLDALLHLICDLPALNLLEQLLLARRQMRAELRFPARDLVDRDRVKLWLVNHACQFAVRDDSVRNRESTHKTVNAGIDDGDLNFGSHGLILALLCTHKHNVSNSTQCTEIVRR